MKRDVNKVDRNGTVQSSSTAMVTNGELPHRARNNQLRIVERRSESPLQRPLSVQDKSMSASQSSILSTSTQSTITGSADTASMSAQQLCQLGLTTLHVAISHWEAALIKVKSIDDTDSALSMDPSIADLQHQLESLIDKASCVEQEYERTLERHADAAAMDSAMSALAEMNKQYELERLRTLSGDEESSDQDSFVSASEMPDLTDLDFQKKRHSHLAFYDAGLIELKHGSIPCRTLRTRIVNCTSDAEFLAKLHCIRIAFGELLKDSSIKDWMGTVGKDMIGGILNKADRDPDDFYAAFDEMITFLERDGSWEILEEELRGRGVKAFSFYDIALDFILLDAFDDLENLPSSVMAVVQNRWLSNGFKETALSTVVWSLLKAKRRMLKFPDGFMAHFYTISEHVSPVLVWGFTGPVEEIRSLCYFFKEQVLGFIQDIFSFEKAHYQTVEGLADDIHRLARDRFHILEQKLAS